MTTLVIHPQDPTTDFLTDIYTGKEWLVIRNNVSKRYLLEQITAHDRIIMLGHGSSDGLFGAGRLLINSKLVYLLRDKYCVCIWCNADMFVKKYGLHGLYTGMIISDTDEAESYCLYPCSNANIQISNTLLAKSIANAIDSKDPVAVIKKQYISNGNAVIQFNKDNIYIKDK